MRALTLLTITCAVMFVWACGYATGTRAGDATAEDAMARTRSAEADVEGARKLLVDARADAQDTHYRCFIEALEQDKRWATVCVEQIGCLCARWRP